MGLQMLKDILAKSKIYKVKCFIYMFKDLCVFNKIVLLKVSFPSILKVLVSFIHLLFKNVKNLLHQTPVNNDKNFDC